ncbi:MAG: hypothetical protein RBR65_08530 [Aliarcobacter sp.]|jgi:hypothetical protein|nr:hypothetical protein [Aliarcobacter sp.]
MVKIFLILILSITFLLAEKTNDVIYNLNCVGCHKKLPVTIDKYFYRYLLKYSSETKVKEAMFKYLKKPTKEETIMAESFITRFGVKKRTKLPDDKLNEALNSYWDKYKVFGKLK